MRIETIIIDHEQNNTAYLKSCLLAKFPEISIQGEALNYSEANNLIQTVNPTLVFFSVGSIQSNSMALLRKKNYNHFEMVYISDRPEDAIVAIRQDACGFLLKPFNVGDIVDSVSDAIRKLSEKASSRVMNLGVANYPHSKLIGIPMIDGIEFLNAAEIIRCEGLQKCTRIITVQKNNMVSSYSIGEFRRILKDYGFFSCHKSHLINLMYVRKLTREGFIILSDNNSVPLARRKRLEFLQNLKHI